MQAEVNPVCSIVKYDKCSKKINFTLIVHLINLNSKKHWESKYSKGQKQTLEEKIFW
jgi:hypothetical protein